jgi:hypothetical protein
MIATSAYLAAEIDESSKDSAEVRSVGSERSEVPEEESAKRYTEKTFNHESPPGGK